MRLPEVHCPPKKNKKTISSPPPYPQPTPPAKQGASLKFTVLNPRGRVWLMVAGGGASVIYADTVGDLGYAQVRGAGGPFWGVFWCVCQRNLVGLKLQSLVVTQQCRRSGGPGARKCTPPLDPPPSNPHHLHPPTPHPPPGAGKLRGVQRRPQHRGDLPVRAHSHTDRHGCGAAAARGVGERPGGGGVRRWGTEGRWAGGGVWGVCAGLSNLPARTGPPAQPKPPRQPLPETPPTMPLSTARPRAKLERTHPPPPANPDGRGRALLIGGGIANFTDVAATFKGIIRAIREQVGGRGGGCFLMGGGEGGVCFLWGGGGGRACFFNVCGGARCL